VVAKLIIFAGLPGSGKSTFADYASTKLGIPIIAKDWVEAAMLRHGITKDMGSGSAAYDVLISLAEEQLQRNIPIILDSVSGSASLRKTWHKIAEKHGAELLVVECLCSDETTHRSRLEARKRHIDGWPELTWDDVLKVKANYAEWEKADRNRLTLDSMDNFEDNAAKLLAYLH